MSKLFTWYRDIVADAKNVEDIATKMELAVDRNEAFRTFLNTNRIVPPYQNIPLEKLTSFSKEHSFYIIVIICSTGETTLIESGIISSFPNEEMAKISCGLKKPRSLQVYIAS